MAVRPRLTDLCLIFGALAALCTRSASAQDLPAWGDSTDWEQPADSASLQTDTSPSWEEGGDLNQQPQASAPDDRYTAQTFAADANVDARIRQLDRYLEDIQGPTRAYFWSWMGLQAGLVVGQGAYALSSEDKIIRTSYFIGTGVAAISVGLFLLQKWPGSRAVDRYRAMPSDTERDKREKLAAGEEWLAAQAAADKRATSWLRHALGIGAALGSAGLIVLLHEHSLKEAVRRTFATFLIAELQILTRPRKARQFYEEYQGSTDRKVDLSFAPWVERKAQGLSLHARF